MPILPSEAYRLDEVVAARADVAALRGIRVVSEWSDPVVVTGDRSPIARVIDNLILSGKTAQELVQTITAHGGTPIGIGALADLSGVDFPIAVHGLLNPFLDIHAPATCPACEAGVPLTEVGY